jgi:hypothetical protein
MLYAVTENPRRTPSRAKRAIYGWTLAIEALNQTRRDTLKESFKVLDAYDITILDPVLRGTRFTE